MIEHLKDFQVQIRDLIVELSDLRLHELGPRDNGDVPARLSSLIRDVNLNGVEVLCASFRPVLVEVRVRNDLVEARLLAFLDFLACIHTHRLLMPAWLSSYFG